MQFAHFNIPRCCSPPASWKAFALSTSPRAGRPDDRGAKMRTTICAIVFICASCLSAGAQQGAPAAVTVGTVAAERKPIAQSLDFVGRVEAVDRVEIKARVTGYLEALLFKEGDLIKEGDALYRIEKGLFQAAVDTAEGALERRKASKVSRA